MNARRHSRATIVIVDQDGGEQTINGDVIVSEENGICQGVEVLTEQSLRPISWAECLAEHR